MSAPPPPPFAEIPFARRLGPWRAFAFCAIPTLLGLTAAAAAHFFVVLPTLKLGSTGLDRVVALASHLRESPPDTPRLVFVGDSVTVEGIDASLVERAAPPGWKVENLGINGCDRPHVAVILPTVLASKPRAMVILVRPITITRGMLIETDVAHAYVLGGYAKDWPPQWVTPESDGVDRKIFEALTGPAWQSKLHFRTAIRESINNRLRERFNRNLRPVRADDWIAPFNLSGSIEGSLLEQHLRLLEAEVRDTAGPADVPPGASAARIDTSAGEADFERHVALIQAAGVDLTLIVAPLHPRLMREGEAPMFRATALRVREFARELGARRGLGVADASEGLLSEDSFADAHHPNERGRAALSEFVGRALPPPTAPGEGRP